MFYSKNINNKNWLLSFYEYENELSCFLHDYFLLFNISAPIATARIVPQFVYPQCLKDKLEFSLYSGLNATNIQYVINQTGRPVTSGNLFSLDLWNFSNNAILNNTINDQNAVGIRLGYNNYSWHSKYTMNLVKKYSKFSSNAMPMYIDGWSLGLQYRHTFEKIKRF